jgi:hypothetical protein
VDHHREIVLSALENSIRQAATQIDDVADNPSPSESWHSSVDAAIRKAILAIERHFGDLAGEDGLIHEIQTDDPRLIGTLERHEAALARLLVEMWETREAVTSADEEHVERLRWLAGQLRHCANREITILYETFNPPPGID